MAGRAHPHVLIVDDEESIQDVLSMVFGRAGFQTTCAASVAEAVENLSRRPTHLTLDLNLPDGNGAQVLRHVRHGRLPIRVAVVTGAMELGLLAEVSRLQPDHTFQKPFRPAELVTWVHETTRQRPHSSYEMGAPPVSSTSTGELPCRI